MLGDKPKILTLDDVGTRYEHYVELKELFAEGVEVIKSAISYQPTNEMNKRRLESLQHAVTEIDHRLDVISGFEEATSRWSKFGRELDSIKPNQTAQLTGVTEGSDVMPQEIEPKDKSLPPCPNRTGEDYEAPNGYAH